PAGIIINTETGLDPANNKMIVIPVVAYPKVQELFKLYSVELNSSDSVDIEVAARIQKTNDLFITAFKQNMALITLNHNIPDGVRAGLSPESYNILIDSVDVNQAVEGTYVYRNAANIRTTSDIRQR
ncbi:MAG: hypothetical protein KDH96_10420, partial [Candidatus Riesia sp.]|nr:hypothetical protein [Candidatus Riesia sp.]